MNIPLYSTLTLIAEIFVTSCILYVFYQGYKNNKFNNKLAFATLTYEVLFNISYMLFRTASRNTTITHTPFHIFLAIFHGTLSLAMFLALIVFMITAFSNYRKGVNYFKEHKYVSFTFLFFWMVSVISGVVFYFNTYF